MLFIAPTGWPSLLDLNCWRKVTNRHRTFAFMAKPCGIFDDRRIVELRAGELFYIPPVPHDSWAIGNERDVSLHLIGAEKYAK